MAGHPSERFEICCSSHNTAATRACLTRSSSRRRRCVRLWGQEQSRTSRAGRSWGCAALRAFGAGRSSTALPARFEERAPGRPVCIWPGANFPGPFLQRGRRVVARRFTCRHAAIYPELGAYLTRICASNMVVFPQVKDELVGPTTLEHFGPSHGGSSGMAISLTASLSPASRPP